MSLGLTFLGFFAGLISIFLMFLILIQRGKGGGLTGALGGMGGQSAFGSKAGDLFTRITVITAIIWMTCCLLIIKIYNYPPATAEISNTSGELTTEETGTGTGLTGEGGGDFVPNTDKGDETTGDDADTSTDPIIGDDDNTTGDDAEAGEGETGETTDDDPAIIDPETNKDAENNDDN